MLTSAGCYFFGEGESFALLDGFFLLLGGVELGVIKDFDIAGSF